MLTEGAKVSQALLQQALNDPRHTIGFEIEFFLDGAKSLVSKTRSNDTDDGTKVVGELNWDDILHHFGALGVDEKDDRSNHIVMSDRLENVYQTLGGEVDGKRHHEMWEEMKSNGVHKLITVLGLFPVHGFAGMNDDQNNTALSIIYDRDIDSMPEKLNTFSINLSPEEDHGSEASIATLNEIVANDLTQKLGTKVLHTTDDSRVFHIGGYESWVLAPDISLQQRAAVSEDMMGLELISPIMPAEEGLNKLFEVLNIMRGGIANMKVVTTEETGLHVNLGVQGKELDTAKLLVLLDDEHILRQFKRETNPNAQSVRAKTVQRMRAAAQGQQLTKATPEELIAQVQDTLSKIKLTPEDVERLKQLMNGIKPESKGHSINFGNLPSHVEFRSIGNANYHVNTGPVKQSIMQMITMTYAATEPSVYRKEFLKKLYQMVIAPQQVTDSVGPIGGGTRGGYGVPIEDEEKTPYDGENYIRYGFDPGSQTQ